MSTTPFDDPQDAPAALSRQEALKQREGGEWSARRKWGKAVDAGFMVVPDTLLRAQSVLELDTVDLAILLNIVMHWWSAGELPYPRPSVIAKRIGVTPRTVQRRLVELQNKGLIQRLGAERIKGGLSVRRFDLSGLVGRLEGLAAKNMLDRQRPSERNQLQLPATHAPHAEFAVMKRGRKTELRGGVSRVPAAEVVKLKPPVPGPTDWSNWQVREAGLAKVVK